MQRHHLLPRQALDSVGLRRLLCRATLERVGFHDFRRNGMLLPACERAARRTLLPLHRGPHRRYNEMALDRLGAIEGWWSRQRRTDAAQSEAVQRIVLLQKALRRRLLDARQPLRLNVNCPIGAGLDFALLDTMADRLWEAPG